MVDFQLQNLVDLHTHLSTSTTAHLLWEMAHNRGIKLEEKNYWKFLDLVQIDTENPYNSYHDYFDVAQRIQSSPEAVEQSVYEAISLSYRKANTNLLEIRFNPMRRNFDGLFDLDRIIYAALVGMKKACMIYPVKAGLIIEMDRRFSPEKNSIIVNKAIGFKNEGVIGIDVSGPAVVGFDINDLLKPIEKAKSNGLKITVHSGEEGDISEMWDVVNKIQPDRIGHGIKSVTDAKLLEILAKKQIHLEVCPTSNLSLKLVKDWDEVKSILDSFKQYNISFNINSDGPVILSTNVKKEYEQLLNRNILSLDDVQNCLTNARKHSFISESPFIK
jgi:adenosine deaminase